MRHWGMPMDPADLDTIRLWCRASIPQERWSQQRIECFVTGRHVDLIDVRPGAGASDDRRTPIARLRFVGQSGRWTLQWRDGAGRFHDYRHLPPVTEVQRVLAFLAEARDPLFWPLLVAEGPDPQRAWNSGPMATVIVHTQGVEPVSLPLVLLAPFPCDARAWAEVASRLGDGVLTIDPPGFGGQIDGTPALEGYARAVLASLHDRGIDRFVVAGNSMGGYAALCLAELAPDRVAGLGLFGTKSTADAPEARHGRHVMADAAAAGQPVAELLAPMVAKLLGDSTREAKPDVVATLASIVADASAEGVAWAQRAMAARGDRTAVLSGFNGPVVIVRGVEDPLMDAASQRVMTEAAGVELIEARCGHLIPLEAPDLAVDVLRGLWRAAQSAES